jgi:hypothetical protein
MKIHIFTIRNRATNALIYAEGTNQDGLYRSFFELDEKWLTDEEKQHSGWFEDGDGSAQYVYDNEVRHLFHHDYRFVKFALEEVEYN